MRKDVTVLESSFTCKRGDLTIRGIVAREKGKENLPIVIVSHGFMTNHESVLGYVRQFARWGYAAFCFDFCGGCIVGSSDGKTTDMTVFTEREDLKAVIAYAKTQDYVDAETLLLMGCSQGGFVSGLTAAELGDAVTALVMFYPALSIPDDARRGSMVMARFDPEDIPETILCGPMMIGRCYPEVVMDMDPFEEIKVYGGPVFIAHGTRDRLVPVTYSEKAYAAYTDGADQKPRRKLLLIEGADHGFSAEYAEIAINGLETFLDANGLK